MQPLIIATQEDYERAQLRVQQLGRPVIDSPEEQEQVALSKATLEWELRDAEISES